MNKGIDVSSHQGTIDWKQVKGIASAVDLNYGYEDYPDMMITAGLNGYPKSSVPKYREHRVAKNENLWGIAEKYLGSGADMPKSRC